jgi:hypothetical protein
MSLFNKDGENAKLHASLDRISAMPLADLAAEVLEKGFNGEGEGAGGNPTTIPTVGGYFNPAQGSFGIDDQALVDMGVVMAEAFQVLEHACLIRMEVAGSGGIYGSNYRTTRLGRDALANGTVAKALGGPSPPA